MTLLPLTSFQNGNTALMEASENGHTTVVKALVDNGAGIAKQNKVCIYLQECDIPVFHLP